MEAPASDLKTAVERMHQCSAQLVETVTVSEFFEGKPVWNGLVHVFDLTNHPFATRAYAWSSPVKDSPNRRFFAVLHVPPITSPQAAVRAAIVEEYRSQAGR